MNEANLLVMGMQDWFNLVQHVVSLSLICVGGVSSILPALHLYIVTQHRLLSETQFNDSYAIAQSAPGPNVLYVAVFGWMIGISTGSIMVGIMGALLMAASISLPAGLVTYFVSQWLQKNRESRFVQAFRKGMLPLVIALALASAWLMISVHNDIEKDWKLWILCAISAVVIWRTRIHILWLLGIGALLGAFGLI